MRHPGLQGQGEARSALDIRGEYRARSPVPGLARDPERVPFVPGPHDGGHRARDLVPGDRRLSGEHVRRQQQSRRPARLATEYLPGAVTAGPVQLVLDRAQQPGVDDRADVGIRGGRVTSAQASHYHQESLRELLVHLPVHDEPAGDRADLVLASEGPEHGGVHRTPEVSVIEDHEGPAAARLMDQTLTVRLPGQSRAGRRRAADPDHARDRMRRDCLADLVAGPDHHAEQPVRQSCLLVDLRQQQSAGDRRITGRLEDHRVADGERGGNGPAGHPQRSVPRADHRDHPGGHPVGPVLPARKIRWHDAAGHLMRQAGCPEHRRARQVPLQFGRCDRGAGLVGQPAGNLSPTVARHGGSGQHDIGPARG